MNRSCRDQVASFFSRCSPNHPPPPTLHPLPTQILQLLLLLSAHLQLQKPSNGTRVSCWSRGENSYIPGSSSVPWPLTPAFWPLSSALCLLFFVSALWPLPPGPYLLVLIVLSPDVTPGLEIWLSGWTLALHDGVLDSITSIAKTNPSVMALPRTLNAPTQFRRREFLRIWAKDSRRSAGGYLWLWGLESGGFSFFLGKLKCLPYTNMLRPLEHTQGWKAVLPEGLLHNNTERSRMALVLEC